MSLSAGLALFWGEGPALSPKFELSAGLALLEFFYNRKTRLKLITPDLVNITK